MSKRFTTSQLAAFRLPGYPATSQGWDKRVKNEGWENVTVHGRGRGGERHEYAPPPAILSLIEQHLRGELPPAPAKAKPTKEIQYQTMQAGDGSMLMAMSQAPANVPQEINQHIQWMCLDACLSVYGPEFAAENAALQIEHATDLYNLLVRLATVKIGDKTAALEDFSRIDAEQMADLQRMLLTMRWLKPYRPASGIPPGAESWSW